MNTDSECWPGEHAVRRWITDNSTLLEGMSRAVGKDVRPALIAIAQRIGVRPRRLPMPCHQPYRRRPCERRRPVLSRGVSR